MLAPGQLIEVKVIGITLQHYRDLGYDVKCFDTIVVPPEHLTDGSRYMVDVLCDICKKKIPRTYKKYLKHHKEGFDTCNQCKDKKIKQTCMTRYGVPTPMLVPEVQEKQKEIFQKKYGVENISQSEQIKEKKKQTCMKNFGVENPASSDIIQEKIKETCKKKYGCDYPTQNEVVKEKIRYTNIEKYGFSSPVKNPAIQQKIRETNIDTYGVECVLQSEEIKEKIALTNIKKYGVKNPFAAQEIKDKIKQTNLLKYGVEYPSQNPDIKSKAIKTMCDNNNVLTSKQQLELHKIIQQKYPEAVLNYPFLTYFLDIFICIDDIKIDIEYDGWYWHKNKQKDLKRDKFLQSYGFKILRIRSGTLLPAENELFNAVSHLVNTECCFKEIILSDWKGVDDNESLLNITAV